MPEPGNIRDPLIGKVKRRDPRQGIQIGRGYHVAVFLPQGDPQRFVKRRVGYDLDGDGCRYGQGRILYTYCGHGQHGGFLVGADRKRGFVYGVAGCTGFTGWIH